MKKILGALVLVAALAGCSGDGDAAPSEKESSSSPPKWDTGAAAEVREPTAGDFTLDVRVKSKECFGSAGCNVVFEVVPTVTDLKLLADRTTEVTYEATGFEDDPIIGTITFTDDQHDVQEEVVTIPTKDGEISVDVTDVLVR